MKCSEKACPYPERRDGLCAQHLQDRTLEASTVGGSLPLMQEYAPFDDWRNHRAGNGSGNGARHLGPRSAEL